MIRRFQGPVQFPAGSVPAHRELGDCEKKSETINVKKKGIVNDGPRTVLGAAKTEGDECYDVEQGKHPQNSDDCQHEVDVAHLHNGQTAIKLC